jgi:predicted phage-related endonuclease
MDPMEKYGARKRVKLIAHSPDWYEFRRRGLGGSEVGAVLGLNPWLSRWVLYEEKVGIRPRRDGINEPMINGLFMEDTVADWWKFYDGQQVAGPDGETVSSRILRMYEYDQAVATAMQAQVEWDRASKAGTAVGDRPEVPHITEFHARRCQRINYTLYREKVPWLYANLDRVIPAGQFRLGAHGGLLEHASPLECKTINGFHARKYEQGYPPYWHAQGHLQMMCIGSTYCEYAYLVDGRDFGVINYDIDHTFLERILEETYEFWQLVESGQKAVARLEDPTLTEADREEVYQEVDNYLPAPDDADEGYQEFLKERYRVENMENEEMTMSDADPDNDRLKGLILADMGFFELEKAFKKARAAVQTGLARECMERQRIYIKMPEGFSFSFRPLKEGNKPTLKSKAPVKVDPDQVAAVLQSITVDNLFK